MKCSINLTLLSINHCKSFPIDSHRVVKNVGHVDFMSAIKFLIAQLIEGSLHHKIKMVCSTPDLKDA